MTEKTKQREEVKLLTEKREEKLFAIVCRCGDNFSTYRSYHEHFEENHTGNGSIVSPSKRRYRKDNIVEDWDSDK